MIAAQGPGSATMETSASIAARTTRKPGSEMPGIPAPRWDTITASFEVEAGNGFSVEINKASVTAEVVAEADASEVHRHGG